MIKILHLYPQLMNLYGDYGNLAVLCRHLEDLGEKVRIDRKEPDDVFSLYNYDLIYMGSGTENNQKVALQKLKRQAHILRSCLENDKVILFTGNAMELMGKQIDGEEGLGLIDFTVKTEEKRYTGDVILHNDRIGEVVGFINKSTLIEGGKENALFTYEFRDSNLVDNDFEGYRLRNMFGTHVIGPVLVKNPNFLNEIVELLAGSSYRRISYDHEEKAYETTLNELRKRKKE